MHRTTQLLLAVILAAPAPSSAPANDSRGTGRIVWTQNGAALDLFEPRPETIRRMVDAVIQNLAGRQTTSAAWRQFVDPGDRVGILVSSPGGPVMGTRTPVIRAVVDGLVESGVPRRNITVFARERATLDAAGITPQSTGSRVIALAEEWDPDSFFTAPTLGRLIHGDLLFRPGLSSFSDAGSNPEAFSSKSHFGKTMSSGVDSIINIPVLAESQFTGIAGALANPTVAAVDNWRRFTRPPRFGDPEIVQMWLDEVLSERIVLHLLDALVVQYAGWPDFSAYYSVAHGAIYASRDPVALDTYSLLLLENWRVGAKLPPVGQRARHVETAGRAGLGEGDPEKISMRQVWTP